MIATRHLICQNWRCKAEFTATRGMGAPLKYCSKDCWAEARGERRRLQTARLGKARGRRPLPRKACPSCGKEHACNALAHRVGP